ncbi:MAG: hypothetical protein U5J64_06300 [Halobacteriales archaeon]|nr:hypothetical protein [Halobacteriales archaeon]
MDATATVTNVETAALLALLASGVFFMVGLLTGVWKYRCMWTSEDAQAPYYVNTAHRASLLYSFGSLVLYHFVLYSPWSPMVNLVSVALPVFFFGFAVTTYVIHGYLRDTENQFEEPHVLGRFEIPPVVVRGSMWLLILGEVGGFGVLFVGFVLRLF